MQPSYSSPRLAAWGLGLARIKKVRARPFERRPYRNPCTYCGEIYSRKNSRKLGRGIDTHIAIRFLITDDLIQDAAARRDIKTIELHASMAAISENELG